MKKLFVLFALAISMSASAQSWVDITPPSSINPDARLWIKGTHDPVAGINRFSREYLYFEDTIHVFLKSSGYPVGHKLLFNVRNCNIMRLLVDTILASDLSEGAWVVFTVPFFNLNCTDSESSAGKTTKMSVGLFDVNASLSVLGRRPLGLEDEYYKDLSNVLSTEFFNQNGQKISPDGYSGLMIVKTIYLNYQIRSIKTLSGNLRQE
jgi:hypothetical protein